MVEKIKNGSVWIQFPSLNLDGYIVAQLPAKTYLTPLALIQIADWQRAIPRGAELRRRQHHPRLGHRHLTRGPAGDHQLHQRRERLTRRRRRATTIISPRRPSSTLPSSRDSISSPGLTPGTPHVPKLLLLVERKRAPSNVIKIYIGIYMWLHILSHWEKNHIEENKNMYMNITSTCWTALLAPDLGQLRAGMTCLDQHVFVLPSPMLLFVLLPSELGRLFFLRFRHFPSG